MGKPPRSRVPCLGASVPDSELNGEATLGSLPLGTQLWRCGAERGRELALALVSKAVIRHLTLSNLLKSLMLSVLIWKMGVKITSTKPSNETSGAGAQDTPSR